MRIAKAFSPANISCIFKIYEHKNPRWMGSYGVGFTLDQGVIVEVKKAKKTGVIFNGTNIRFPTVKNVVDDLSDQNLEVSIKTKLPLGCGFGLSGASALAASYAINDLLHLKKSKKQLAVIAHTAEVQNKTGLGDVVNQYYGGFCLKLEPSSHFSIKKIPIRNANVHCRYFGKLSTKSIITDENLGGRINNSASDALDKIEKLLEKKKIAFSDIIKISKEFSQGSGLLRNKRVINQIKKIEQNGGNASMIMLGNAVFSDVKFEGSINFKISNKRACLLQ